jgi:RING finger protein 113A
MFKKRNLNNLGSKRKSTQLDQSLSGSDSDSDSDSGPVVLLSKKLKSESKSFRKPVDTGAVKYEHSHSADLKDSASYATKENRLYIEAKEEEALKKKSQVDQSKPDGTYKGVANYTKFTNGLKKAKFGPVKSVSANVRTSTVIDYQPDVCKDYKQTGFCGYGDSCKFLHSREDYKAGWKLDQEWEEAQSLIKGKSTKDESDIGKSLPDKSSSDDIPFKCVICKNDYDNPVVTNCVHYFCESCFLAEYRKKPGCYICGKETNGIAKPAKALSKLLATRRNE